MSKSAFARVPDATSGMLRGPGTTHSESVRAGPFVKWAGGKRTVVPHIMQVLPRKFGDYYEPFVGGGALFFALIDRIQRACLSDMNKELIQTYKVIKSKPEALIRQLKVHKRRHSGDYFYKVREHSDEKDPVKIAARFIYLNKTCYNGLYRVNRVGQFNAPLGSYKNPAICDEENILAASRVLKKTTLKRQAFNKIDPGPGDLVYCDPPYHECFAQYTADGFTEESQVELRVACDRWRDNGAYIIVSNADTDFIRRTWRGYHFEGMKVPRCINSRGSERSATAELLILS